MPAHRIKAGGEALKARAARAAEDPVAMTTDAILGRLAIHVVGLHEENPDLAPAQLAKGARLRLRAEMAALNERKAQLRQERAPGAGRDLLSWAPG
jgi:hypothetical protein